MKKIPLTQGKYAIVDDADFDVLSQYKWRIFKKKDTSYAISSCARAGSKRQTIYMHREVAQTPKGMDTDHRNGDGLNNQRSNLRVCTSMENKRNRRISINNKSGFKGVSWSKGREMWQAQIHAGVGIHLGYFTAKELAYGAYVDAAKLYHGDFARV
jgi:hypothetical protein